MGIINAGYVLLFGMLSIMTVRSDLQEGLIKNSTLLLFTCLGGIIDIFYYTYTARELLPLFLINTVAVMAISLMLFYTHSFAGGDCKLAIAMAILYPAGYYYAYKGTRLTLIFAIAAAIFYGYVYILLSAIGGIISGKTQLSWRVIKSELTRFIKSYARMMIYICAVNFLFVIPEAKGLCIDSWIISISCIAIAWMLSGSRIINNRSITICVLTVDIIVSLITKSVPVSLNPASYSLVLILLICQMTIKTALYENIKVESLKKGMILTMGASLIMQSSKVSGLPGVSTEDLKSRLSEKEVNSIKKWAAIKHVDSIAVVKKYPFAIFLVLGYFTYFIMWSISL